MTKWHLTLIFCFFLLREKTKRNKRKGNPGLNENWRCPAWLQAGSGAGGGRGRGEGEDSRPGSVFSRRSEWGTSIFVTLCTFRSGGNLIAARFVYWSTFPASPSGNVRAGSLPFAASTRGPRPHLPFLRRWLQPPAGASSPAPRQVPLRPPEGPGWVLPARYFPLPPAPGRVC